MALRPWWKPTVDTGANRVKIGDIVMAFGSYDHIATSSSDLVDFSSLVVMDSTDYRVIVHRMTRSGGPMSIQDSPLTNDPGNPKTTTDFTLDYGTSLVAGWSFDWIVIGKGTLA